MKDFTQTASCQTVTEKVSQSKESLLRELQEKEKEVEDAMMIVSVLQEQVPHIVFTWVVRL